MGKAINGPFYVAYGNCDKAYINYDAYWQVQHLGESFVWELLKQTKQEGMIPAIIAQWKQVAQYCHDSGNHETIDELCARIVDVEKPSLRHDLQGIIVNHIFGLVGALTINHDFARELADKVDQRFRKRNIRRYQRLLTRNLKYPE